MPGLSSADQRVSPPRIDIPREYNAAHDLLERNIAAGRADKVAFVDDANSITYGDLARRVDRPTLAHEHACRDDGETREPREDLGGRCE